MVVFVAIAAIAFGGVAAYSRWRRQQAEWATKAAFYQRCLEQNERNLLIHANMITVQPERSDFHHARVAYHMRLLAKYARAVAEPWIHVPTDPSPP